jgi:hypothetical protein
MAVAFNSNTHTTWVRFWGSWSLVESKGCHYVMVEADSQLKLLPTYTLDIQCVWAHRYTVHGRTVVASNSNTHITWNFDVLGHLCSQNDVITSWLRRLAHQTAPCIYIRHIKIVWAHWYAVHGHTAVALNSYTHTSWLIFWGSGSLLESKWCHYVMVEADSHLKLLAASTLDIYKVFEHIDMLSMGIRH